MKTKRSNARPTLEQKKLIFRALISLLSISAFIAAGIFFAERFLSKEQPAKSEQAEQSSNAAKQDFVSYNGQDYRLNTNLSTILLMGIDRNFDNAAPQSSARNGGQADFLALMIIDSKNQTVTRLQIDRDTMSEITILGVLGNKSGTKNLQICLSHGYGDGREQSCELTKQAVEHLLFDISIDDYLAVSLGGIGALNDALGGVVVPVEDDFSYYDKTMVTGTEIRLTAQQAEYYVRRRTAIGEETNESRMRRQSNFIRSGAEQASQLLKSDLNFANSLFDAMEPYLTTDMSRGKIINLVNRYMDNPLLTESLTIQGEYSKGADSFTEFHADQNALYELVINTFYEPVP